MSKETTLSDYAALADKAYGDQAFDYHLPDHIVREPMSVELFNRNENFHAEVYRNTETGEIIVAVRGTKGAGDIRDWPEAAVGVDTEQTPTAKAYVEAVIVDAREAYPGATVTLVGHSLGGQQVQEMLTETRKEFPGDGNIRGIGFNAPGIGLFEADSGIDYVEVNVEGDIVRPGGFSSRGDTEIVVDLGHAPISLDAHKMAGLALALEGSGDVGSMTFEEINGISGKLRVDLTDQRSQVDRLSDKHEELEAGRIKLDRVDDRVAELETTFLRPAELTVVDLEVRRLEYERLLENQRELEQGVDILRSEVALGMRCVSGGTAACRGETTVRRKPLLLSPCLICVVLTEG
ncbi:MAG: hypothetical protein M5U09_05145 [Gammaproteobacteria bacterium]|nr:hypothetical protein [Gammaproteobacteria bacterium]